MIAIARKVRARTTAGYALALLLVPGCGPSYSTVVARHDAYCPEFGSAQLLPEDETYYKDRPPEAMMEIAVPGRTDWATVAVGLVTMAASEPGKKAQMLRAYRAICPSRHGFPGWLSRQHDAEVSKTEGYCKDWGRATLTSEDDAKFKNDANFKVAVRRVHEQGYAELTDDEYQERLFVPARLVAEGGKLHDDTALWTAYDKACMGGRPAWYVNQVRVRQATENKEEAAQDLADYEAKQAVPLRNKVRQLEAAMADAPSKTPEAEARLRKLAIEYAGIRTLTYELAGRIATRQADRVYLSSAQAADEVPEGGWASYAGEVERTAAGVLSGGPAVLLEPTADDFVQGVEVEAAGVYFQGLTQAMNQYGQKTMVFTYTHKKPTNPKADELGKQVAAAMALLKELKARIEPCVSAKRELAEVEEELAERRTRVEQLKAGLEKHQKAARETDSR